MMLVLDGWRDSWGALARSGWLEEGVRANEFILLSVSLSLNNHLKDVRQHSSISFFIIY
jgi:hypothetical protein